MKKNIIGLVFGILGAVFGILGAAMLVISSLTALNMVSEEQLAMRIVGTTFSILGGAFLLTSIISIFVTRARKKHAEHLMREGVAYNAEIVRSYMDVRFRVNFISPVVFECVYRDRMGKNCLVKSGRIWLDNPYSGTQGMSAKVWVNPDNPRDYHVEISTGAANVNYDNDYR